MQFGDPAAERLGIAFEGIEGIPHASRGGGIVTAYLDPQRQFLDGRSQRDLILVDFLQCVMQRIRHAHYSFGLEVQTPRAQVGAVGLQQYACHSKGTDRPVVYL